MCERLLGEMAKLRLLSCWPRIREDGVLEYVWENKDAKSAFEQMAQLCLTKRAADGYASTNAEDIDDSGWLANNRTYEIRRR